MEKRFELEVRDGRPILHEVSHLGEQEGFSVQEMEFLLDGMMDALGLDSSLKPELIYWMKHWDSIGMAIPSLH